MLFFSVLFIGIAGKKHVQNLQEAIVEKQSVEVLKNTFSGIVEVKFEQIIYDSITDTYGIFVMAKNSNGKSSYFSYDYSKNSFKIDNYKSKDKIFLVKGITKNKVKVIYSNGKEIYV